MLALFSPLELMAALMVFGFLGVVWVTPICLIAQRLGYHWAVGLLSAVPVVNIAVLWVLALAPNNRAASPPAARL